MASNQENEIITSGSSFGNLLFTTVRIETEGEDGLGSGTGFIFSYQYDKLNDTPLLITNRHVVEGKHTGRIYFLQSVDESLTAAYAKKAFQFLFTEFQEHWFFHPDPTIDLCVLPLSIWLYKALKEKNVRIFLRAIKKDLVPNTDQLDAIEDVYMVGYPNAIMDDVNHLPIIRKGITATPWHANYKGRHEFLIDASVFPGSSGSPIFLIDQQWNSLNRIYFLGVLSSGYFRSETNEVVRTSIPTASRKVVNYQEMIDLGVAIKSSVVLDLVNAWHENFSG